MKLPNFAYHRPVTVAEACELLGHYGDEAKVLAGGQSLLPIMQLRLAQPPHLVDITAIRELREHHACEAGHRYGATTTHMMLEQQLVPDVTGGLLAHVAAGIGYRAIRTRGTVAGSLAHSDSSAEWPTVLAALEASVRVSSTRGQRAVPVRELLLGFFTTTLEPDELITAVEVPRLPAESRAGFYKHARKPGEFADSLAVVMRGDRAVSPWLGAGPEVPTHLTRVGEVLAEYPQAQRSASALVEPIAEDLGLDLATVEPSERHALQVHAASIHRAMLATEQGGRHG